MAPWANSCHLIYIAVSLDKHDDIDVRSHHSLLYIATGVLGGQQTYNRRAAVGATPGLTRQVSGFQVCDKPATYVLDTPGIMVPNIPTDETGFRLALAGNRKIQNNNQTNDGRLAMSELETACLLGHLLAWCVEYVV